MTYDQQKNIQIPVTRPFLPPQAEYRSLLDKIWKANWLTNNGPLVQSLENELLEYLDLQDHELVFVSNGTIALQIAIKALNLTGSIITTPFSYVATTSSIVWENCQPVFADIDPDTYNINPDNIAKVITDDASAILATHVFGIPCDVEGIREAADRYGLKVIYDAAHAFGSKYDGQSLFAFGDVSTASFHATKLFHTVEGGALITKNKQTAERFRFMRNFGHDGPWKFNGVGINGKNSEFHAAMGLVNLKYADEILRFRKKLSQLYDNQLNGYGLRRPAIKNPNSYNFSYYPVLFESEELLLKAQACLAEQNIQTRRYFYPVLSELEYLESKEIAPLPVAREVSRRILCLPLYHGLEDEEITLICNTLKKAIHR